MLILGWQDFRQRDQQINKSKSVAVCLRKTEGPVLPELMSERDVVADEITKVVEAQIM